MKYCEAKDITFCKRKLKINFFGARYLGHFLVKIPEFDRLFCHFLSEVILQFYKMRKMMMEFRYVTQQWNAKWRVL